MFGARFFGGFFFGPHYFGEVGATMNFVQSPRLVIVAPELRLATPAVD